MSFATRTRITVCSMPVAGCTLHAKRQLRLGCGRQGVGDSAGRKANKQDSNGFHFCSGRMLAPFINEGAPYPLFVASRTQIAQKSFRLRHADAVDEVELLQEDLRGEGAAQQLPVGGNDFRSLGGGFLQQLDTEA